MSKYGTNGSGIFLSTPSARRATHGENPCHSTEQFLSTPSARRATEQQHPGHHRESISIHALREEGDNPGSPQHWFYLISIHALREEGDPTRPRAFSSTSDFYPRPPRGGRPLHAPVLRLRGNFYPRPPRGGRREWDTKNTTVWTISIHALREEGDVMGKSHREIAKISIHALREEGDAHKTVKENRKAYFYPRPPRGGRLTREYYYSGREQFLSTPSARRATGAYPRRGAQTSDFYPRPPRGGRPLSFAISPYSADFYPRPPRGGRRVSTSGGVRAKNFYPRPPRGGRPHRSGSPPGQDRISIHALREEGDRAVR